MILKSLNITKHIWNVFSFVGKMVKFYCTPVNHVILTKNREELRLFFHFFKISEWSNSIYFTVCKSGISQQDFWHKRIKSYHRIKQFTVQFVT